MSDTELEPERVAELLDSDGATVIDVRDTAEHEAGHVPGTRHVALASLTEHAASIDKSRPVVLYCRGGNRSAMGAEALRASGWDAHNMAGGMLAWADRGLPLEPEGGEVLDRPTLP